MNFESFELAPGIVVHRVPNHPGWSWSSTELGVFSRPIPLDMTTRTDMLSHITGELLERAHCLLNVMKDTGAESTLIVWTKISDETPPDGETVFLKLPDGTFFKGIYAWEEVHECFGITSDSGNIYVDINDWQWAIV